MTDKTDAPGAAWSALARLARTGQARIDNVLAAEGLPAEEFLPLLEELAAAPSQTGVTAKSLEGTLGLPQYAVSRLLGRAIKAGLVTRAPHPQDKRSTLVMATEDARRLYPRMARARDAAIDAFFADRLRPGQVKRLNDLLQMMEDSADE
ncbi:MAG: MarR family winged helix-turn-helix transcriptional regulator [Roseovarius sp.]|jgi:DNA-binding MarR family transcriptional regulator|nr:MarR family winged helix-turn-helix transcriptional regulator [Roseovarius sp.]